jgi:hypothetical protein
MAQNRWINITLDPNAASRTGADHLNDAHGQALGASASGDMTLSYDTAKFTSLSLLRGAVNAALQQAAGSLKP